LYLLLATYYLLLPLTTFYFQLTNLVEHDLLELLVVHLAVTILIRVRVRVIVR